MKYAYFLLFISIALVSCKKDPPIPEIRPHEFQKNYGGTDEDLGKTLTVNSNGDIFIAGSTKSYGAGGKDIFILKTDKDGNLIWKKTLGGTSDDEASEILLADDGGLLVLGTTASFGAGGNDVFLAKMDTSGILLWQKFYGGSANESGEDLLRTAEGNYMITGVTTSFGNGLRDVYIIKVNPSGTMFWSKTFGGAADDGGASLCNADSNQVMLLNFTDNYGALNRDLYVIRINAVGDSLGSWRYGGAEYEEAQSIERTNDGNFIVFGHTASFGHIDHNMYAVKINSNGTVLWENNYGGAIHDGGEHGKQSGEGGYILAGRSYSFQSGYEQMYLVKTDEAGNTEWQKDIGGADDDAAYNLTEADDAYLLIGNTKSITNGNNDVFLVKILKQ